MTVRRSNRYPAYKDSGVEWLGEIPMNWEVKPFKALLSRNDSGVWGDDSTDEGTIVLRSTEQTVNGEWSIEAPARRLLTARESAQARLEVGDLVVTKSSGSELHIGKTSIVDSSVAALRCGFSNFMQRLRVARGHEARFYWYLMNAPVAREQFVFLSSTTTGLGNLNGSILGAIRVPVLPAAEQRAIAAFLDRETARIDALVAKKERLIELLQEQRTALITSAVTKGLDPTVPMKDSGVEWLGEIPAHWEVKKVKRLCLVRRGASPRPIDDPIYFDDEGEYAWVRIADVTASERYLERTTQRLSILGKSKSVALEPGGLFVSIAATVGKPIITKIKCCIHDGFVYFVGLQENREFLFYLFSCGEPYKGLGKLGTQLNLNTDTIGDIYLPRPADAEQKTIVQYLDRETARIDTLVAKVRDAIDRLEELRTALISSAMTGKIDVRAEGA